MSINFDNLESVYFFIGMIVMVTYSWQRFNEPSFPNQETLPHVVEPLRYIFLGQTYRRAMLIYILLTLFLYSLLVLPGPGIVAALRPFGATEANFPVQVWALMVAFASSGFRAQLEDRVADHDRSALTPLRSFLFSSPGWDVANNCCPR
jgi:hypothetical protein